MTLDYPDHPSAGTSTTARSPSDQPVVRLVSDEHEGCDKPGEALPVLTAEIIAKLLNHFSLNELSIEGVAHSIC